MTLNKIYVSDFLIYSLISYKKIINYTENVIGAPKNKNMQNNSLIFQYWTFLYYTTF